MAQIIWTDKPEAARRLVQRVFKHVEQLATHPKKAGQCRRNSAARVTARSSSRPAEFNEMSIDEKLDILQGCFGHEIRAFPPTPPIAAVTPRLFKEWVDKNASLLELEDTGSFYCWSVPR